MASIGSGRSNRRKGRVGAAARAIGSPPSPSARAAPKTAGAAATACSGIWASTSSRRVTRRGPRRALKPSRRSAKARARSASRARSHSLCDGLQRLGEETGKAHQVDAEAGVDLLFGAAGEALGEQARHGARLAERPAGPHDNAAHVAVDAIERELQPARALHLAREQLSEIVGEAAKRRHHRLAGDDRAGEAPLGAKVGRGETRRDRLAR